MAQDVQQIRVAGNLQVHLAAAGSTMPVGLPTDLDTPNLDAAFTQVGFTSPDGSTFTVDRQTQDIFVHQRFGPVRTVVTSETNQLAFVAREWSRTAMKAAFGGGTFSNLGGGVVRYDPPMPGTLNEFALVLDLFDGDAIERYCVARAALTGSMDISFGREAATDLPTTFSCLTGAADEGNWYRLTNADAGAST